jgi:hypothetical protein
VGLDLKAHLEKYPEICKRKFGRTYNFSALEKRFVPLREGQRCLAARDVSHIFRPENTPFGKYWPQPNKKDHCRWLRQCGDHWGRAPREQR